MNLKNYSQVHHLTAIAFILALALVPNASAADGTWTGGTATTWATTSNWLNGIVAGSASANADIATFNSATYLFQPAAASNYFLGGLVFGSSSGGTTITTSTGGNRLNIGSSGIQMNSGTGAVNIGTTGTQGVNMVTNQSWANNSSSLLTVNRAAVDEAAAAGTYTLTINGSGSGGVTMSSGFSDIASASDANRFFALVINSTGGNTTISGSSAYTGGTTLTQGNLLLGNNASLGTGALALNGGKISSSSAGSQAPANNTTIGGNVTLGDAVNTGKLTFSGTMGLGGATRTLTTVTETTFSGVVSNGGITKQGASTLTFLGASANTYTGTTTVNDGTLVLAKTAGVNAIAGGLTIGDGTNSDTVNLGASDQIADTVVVNMIGTASGQRGNFQLLGFKETIGGLSGGGQVQNASSTADSVLTLNVANATTQTSSAVLRNTGGSTTGSLSIVKTGGGTKILGGNMTYTGVTSINEGTLAVTGSLLNSGAVLVNNGGSLSGSGSVGAVTLASGSVLRPGNSPGTLTAASSIWQAGSTYSWETLSIPSSGKAAGTDWDLFSVTGALDMSALSSSAQMNLVLNSLSLASFDTSSTYTWVIAKAGSFTGYNDDNINLTSLFDIDTANFNGGLLANLPTGGFQVVTGTDSSNLRTLNLMAIPEPSTGSMLGFGFGGVVLTRLLRRKQS
ncbi:MAG: autotransporter-associated beta strand repeat-containing protein [Verrucomicrobia bacterium]|nr:autotransporter-associated beta strand repeat-containing protein [Verrucomicrobiota bacterium]